MICTPKCSKESAGKIYGYGGGKNEKSMAKEKPWRHNIELQYNIGIHIVSPEFEFLEFRISSPNLLLTTLHELPFAKSPQVPDHVP